MLVLKSLIVPTETSSSFQSTTALLLKNLCLMAPSDFLKILYICVLVVHFCWLAWKISKLILLLYWSSSVCMSLFCRIMTNHWVFFEFLWSQIARPDLRLMSSLENSRLCHFERVCLEEWQLVLLSVFGWKSIPLLYVFRDRCENLHHLQCQVFEPHDLLIYLIIIIIKY